MPKTTKQIQDVDYDWKSQDDLWFSQSEVEQITESKDFECQKLLSDIRKELIENLKYSNRLNCTSTETTINDVFASHGLVEDKSTSKVCPNTVRMSPSKPNKHKKMRC